MISHEHKCIYIHIPKTGGMTIESALGADVKKLHKSRMKIKHGTPHQWIYPNHWKEYFTFTFVRNPWDRVVSAYFFDLKMYNEGVNRGRRRKIISELGANKFKEFVSQYHQRYLRGPQVLYSSQLKWIAPDYDFIGRFENLQQDFDIVCDKIGIPQQQLSHENKSKHKHYTEYYDDETREIVAEKYAKDIEYFGYEFGE